MSGIGLLCRELGETMGDDELRAMIDEFDKDGDGESKCMQSLHIWLLVFFLLVENNAIAPQNR